MNRGILNNAWVVLTLALMGVGSTACAQRMEELLDLRGHWKFEIGDDERWADLKFDDKDWSDMYVPAAWENEGFPGYDGYAWYRFHFTAKKEWVGKDIYLNLGTVDDVDEAYINGEFIGFQGTFPPKFRTAYSQERVYRVRTEILRPGSDNVIAVRVYDQVLSGGITNGRPGLYEDVNEMRPDIALGTRWKFHTGDNMVWSEPGFDDGSWKTIPVPAFWETQGNWGYDGYAWYRLHFSVPSHLPSDRMVLLLGRIDDIDETYLNGEEVGHTGTMGKHIHIEQYDYAKLRCYAVDADNLLLGRENVIAVRVYDQYMHGGIYDGPIGLITADKYKQWQKTQKKDPSKKNPWQNFFEFFFK
jgi:hypothetical protein